MMNPKSPTFMLGILSVFVFFIKVILNILAGMGYMPFKQSVQNVSDTYKLDITPAGWAFSIWGLIYVWNAAYILYALASAFRDIPPVLNPLFFLLYVLSDVLNPLWLYAFTVNSIIASCVILLGNQLSLYLLLYVVYTNYSSYRRELEERYPVDAWCLRVLVENGVMLNTAWVTIASLLNIGMVLVYNIKASMTLSCTLVLTTLLLFLLVWFTLENFTFQSSLNFTYADWPVVIWALSASLAKNWDPASTSSRFTLALLVITVILLIARITLQVLRDRKTYYHRPPLNEQFINCSM